MTWQAGARHPLGESPLHPAARQGALSALSGSASIAFVCGLPLCAMLLAARRGIAAAQPLTPALLPATAIVLALVAWTGRWLGARSRPLRMSAILCAAPLVTTSTSLLLLGLAIGAGERPWWAALAYWIIVGSEEGWAWRAYLVGRSSFRHFPARSSFGRSSEAKPMPPVIAPTPAVDRELAAPQRLTQEYARASLGDGQEQIKGALHLYVPQGSRTATAHIGFCPPFAARPRFEMRLTAGPPCRLKLGQLLPQGARIEIKLHAPPTAPQTLSLAFTADGSELLR